MSDTRIKHRPFAPFAVAYFKPAKLYRVGRRGDSQGLWHDDQGNETGIIHTIPGAAAAKLPMSPHRMFRQHGRKWISTTHSLVDLRNWFSEGDMRELIARGYELLEVEVTAYRDFHFETYWHQVYAEEDVVAIRSLEPSVLYPTLAEEVAHA